MEEQRAARPDRDRDRARLRGPPRRGPRRSPRGRRPRASSATRSCAPRPACSPSGRATTATLPAGQARGEPLLRRGRRPGRRLGRASAGTAARREVADVYRVGDDQALALGGPTLPSPAPRSRPRSTTRPATRRCATTPRPTCSTRRCARRSAPTSARPARRCAPTSCASTSPTAPRSSPEEAARRRGPGQRVDQGEPPGARAADDRARRPRSSARWRCSARSTATGCGWSRSRTSRASSAAAPTSPTRPRSASSRSPPRARAPPTCAASRRSPAPPRSTTSASASASSARPARCSARRGDPVGGARRAGERLAELERRGPRGRRRRT